jgi:hypothetical protein
LPTQVSYDAHFRAPLNNSFRLMFIIEAILVGGMRWDYCPCVHFKDRAGT